MAERRIRISAGDVVVSAELDDTDAANRLWEALPVQGNANKWGDEIYFSVGIDADLDETAQETVELGAVGYWPPGDALCLFFGPTPMSVGDEIRPASAVNILGMIEGDSTVLKAVADGTPITVEAE
ncbi:MAG: hypothetical protein IH868_09265 [Chloroflexi bacterium]|nr:hypothetical protein [Chloroflexota bacterium]MCH8223583.1 hypothetical protein [Chloroflexota bacterium]